MNVPLKEPVSSFIRVSKPFLTQRFLLRSKLLLPIQFPHSNVSLHLLPVPLLWKDRARLFLKDFLLIFLSSCFSIVYLLPFHIGARILTG